MLRKPIASLVRSGIIMGAALVALSLAGCDTGPHFVGTWKINRTPKEGFPLIEDEMAEMMAPTLKYSVTFTKDGKLTTAWDDEGKSGSRTGTWTMVEDNGLNWRININLPPDEEQWEVKVVSIDTDTISLESTDAFKKTDVLYGRAR